MPTVTVFHNIATDENGRPVAKLDGYAPGHPLVPVAVLVDDDDHSLASAERAFHLFNVGDDPQYGTPDPRAVAYRARGNRSLSVGDVVQVGQVWWACASVGWVSVPKPLWFAGRASMPGTRSVGDGR